MNSIGTPTGAVELLGLGTAIPDFFDNFLSISDISEIIWGVHNLF